MSAGLVIGMVLIRAVESALARVLFEVKPTDIASTAVAAALLLGAALVACIPPTWRAMHVDPIEGLRVE